MTWQRAQFLLPQRMGINHWDGKPVSLKKDEVSMTNGAPSMHGRQQWKFLRRLSSVDGEQLVRT